MAPCGEEVDAADEDKEVEGGGSVGHIASHGPVPLKVQSKK